VLNNSTSYLVKCQERQILTKITDSGHSIRINDVHTIMASSRRDWWQCIPFLTLTALLVVVGRISTAVYAVVHPSLPLKNPSCIGPALFKLFRKISLPWCCGRWKLSGVYDPNSVGDWYISRATQYQLPCLRDLHPVALSRLKCRV